MEEDEDLHNKLKCDQITSDEQIAADNVKISTPETSIFGESARVAQVTEEIDTLEKDIAASKSEFSLCDRDLRETVGGILRGPQINVLGYCESDAITTQSVVPIVPEKSMKMSSIKTSQEQKCSEPSDECVVIFRTVPRNQRECPAYSSQSGEVPTVLKQFLVEMNINIAAAEATELEHKKMFDELSDTKIEEIAASNQQHE